MTPDRLRFFRLLSAVMLPMFLAVADQTLLATATPVITRQLGQMQDTAWIAAGYLLASVVTVPVYGGWGDRLGRRRLLLVAIGVFALGSVACGCAPTMDLLVAARVLQGLGGGGLMTLSQALIGEVVPPRERAKSQGYFAAIFTVASVGGPVLGGLIVHHASWRWLFFINVPLCALAFWRLWTLRADDVPHPVEARTDRLGLVLFAMAMSTSLVWLSSAGHRYAWGSPASLAIVAVALLLWAALLRTERRAAAPFLPIDLLRLPTVRYAVLTVLAFAGAMFAMVFYLPVYLQLALHSNPAESGLFLLPLTVGVVFGSMLTGRLVVWTGRLTVIPVAGLLLAAAALAALVWVPTEARRGLMACCAVAGLGLGSVMSVMQTVTQIAAGPARLGGAAAAMALARTLGSTLGASVFGALIFGNIDGPTALAAAGTTAESVARLRGAFEWAFYGAALLCVVAAVTASRVPNLSLSNRPIGAPDLAPQAH